MSFHSFCRVANRSRNFFQAPNRFASSRRRRSKSIGARLLTYGTLGTMVTVGSTVVYANYNSDFKDTVNEYIPGFGSFANTSGDIWHQGVEFSKAGWDMIKPVIMPDKGNTGIQPPPSSSQPKTHDTSQPLQIVIKEEKGKETGEVPSFPIKGEEPLASENKVKSSDSGKQTEVEKLEVQEVTKDSDSSSTDNTSSVEDKNIHAEKEEVSVQELETSQEPKSVQEPKCESDSDSVQELIKETGVGSDLDALKLSVENELRSLYQDFILKSDKVVDSLQKLTQSLRTQHSKIKDSIDSPPESEVDIEAISEAIGSIKKDVDDAVSRVNESKADQEKVSKRLSAAVAEASNLGILEELVEQICEKALEYERNFDCANEDVNRTRAEHKSWLETLQELRPTSEAIGTEETRELSVDELPPLANLDTQQEALLVMLRKKIDNIEEEEKKRITEALNAQKEELEKEFDDILNKERRTFEEKFISKEHELDMFYEERLKDKLYQQADAYSKHLTESLQTQAEEIRGKLEDDFTKKLSVKDDEYRASLVAAMARLNGIRSMINTVTEAGRSTRKQQNVRAASDSLTSTIIAVNSDPNPYMKHSIRKEVAALKESAKDDEFIQSVLSSIPKEAIKEGISSESGLTKRFAQVRKICKRVSLVGEEGGGLGKYLLSFVQSLVTFDMIYDKMLVRDYNDTANTYRLLSCANGYLEQGDLETAVRLVNQLSGEPRRVARDWVREACLYLETRQAILVVSEYLASSSYTVVQ